jgi:hypothetical protein
MDSFGVRAQRQIPGIPAELARLFNMPQSSMTLNLNVMSCGSSQIDRGSRGWDRGARIFLPPSLLQTILTMQDMGRAAVGEVMLFEVKNKDAVLHVGVQEFIAPEGVCGIPSWMWSQLGITGERQRIIVSQVKLPKGGFVKFKPLQADFMQTHNPKAILEKHLRSFAALTMGMVITIFYGEDYKAKRFDLEVSSLVPLPFVPSLNHFQVVELHEKSGKKLRKGQGVCIIDSDINCDFDEGRSKPVAAAAPAAAVSSHTLSAAERKLVAVSDDDDDSTPSSSSTSSFVGTGRRIKGGSVDVASGGTAAVLAIDSKCAPATEPPALCWTLQFHWYDGQQDSVPPHPADLTAATSRTSSASSDGVPRTKSGGSASSEVSDDPFHGSAHSLKHRKP